MLNALNRLGDLLNHMQKRVELVCCGGVISVLYHHSRAMTHDVDVLLPNDPSLRQLIGSLVDQVGREFSVEHGELSLG